MRGNRRNSQRGSALLTVLWLTAALAAIGIAVASNVRGETERAATNVDDVKTYFAARGAVEREALRYFWGPEFHVPGQPAQDLDFPAAVVHVEMSPENAKLSLNGAKPDELLRLFAALGVAEDRAAGIVEAIIDWRTPDPLHQNPFDSFYLSQAPSFLPRHTSFQETEELLQVRGITPDLYFGSALDRSRSGLRDCLSALSSGGGVDINTAAPAVLQAIGLDPADVATIVKTRSDHAILDPLEFRQIVDAAGPAARRLSIGGQSVVTIRATARLKLANGKLSDMRRTVAALVKFWFAGNQQRHPEGFEIVRWYDRA